MKKMILSLMTVALATASYTANAQSYNDATLSDRTSKVAASTKIDANANLEANDISVPVMNKPKAVSVLNTQSVTNVVDNARVDISSDTNMGNQVDLPVPNVNAPNMASDVMIERSTTTAVIGSNTSADLMMGTEPMEQKTMGMTSDMKHNDHPLCVASHTPRADVMTDNSTSTRVMAPKMIPLTVELANQLSIRGFENIQADGPIGFLTVNDQGNVFFEGQDLSGNVGRLCTSGEMIAPVNASAMKPVMDERAPDGSKYNAMPGQGGFKMQPIVDGPSYKTPPKRKKTVAKKVETKVEAKAVPLLVKEEVTTTVTTDIDDTVPMADKKTVDAAVEASEPVEIKSEKSTTTVITDESGASIMFDGAVEEVLGTGDAN